METTAAAPQGAPAAPQGAPAAPQGAPAAVIVTRHQALATWLVAKLPALAYAPVVAHATAQAVEGKHVYGVLPLHLAALAAKVTEVALPHLAPSQRGKELTLAEMEEAGAHLVSYVVTKV